MKAQTLLFLRTLALAIGISAIAGCGAPDTTNANQPTVTPPNQPAADSANANAPAAGTPTTTTANANQPAGAAPPANCPDCWVHVFDDKGFDVTDDNHMICGPGKWPNLRNLAGAVKPLTTKAMVCNQTCRLGGAYKFSWDFETLEQAALSCGFSKLIRSKINDVPPELAIDGQDWWRPHESLYANLRK